MTMAGNLQVYPFTDNLIRKTAKKPNFEVFEPRLNFQPRLRLEDLEFEVFGLFNRIFDLNTSSCVPHFNGTYPWPQYGAPCVRPFDFLSEFEALVGLLDSFLLLLLLLFSYFLHTFLTDLV